MLTKASSKYNYIAQFCNYLNTKADVATII